MEFTFDSNYNERLYETRHVGFETALEAIARGKVVADYANADLNDSSERVLVVTLDDGTYYLPYLAAGKRWVLHTLFPATRTNPESENANAAILEPRFLNEEERKIIAGLLSSRPNNPHKPEPATLAQMRKAAARLLRRERKGTIHISADGPPDTREHFGEIAGRMGKIGRW